MSPKTIKSTESREASNGEPAPAAGQPGHERPRHTVMWHLVAAVSFVMERRMLRGIKSRAEGHNAAPPATAAPSTVSRNPGSVQIDQR